MCCSRYCFGAALALLGGLLLSPKVAQPTFFDDAFEGLWDTLSPIKPWVPLIEGNGSVAWRDILPPRDQNCPPVYESCEVAHSFQPRATDVIVSTAPKTGTTLVQFMAHLIRSNGHMNFTDLYDVAPWILVNPLYKGDAADVPQPWEPRVFKSHQSLAEFKGGRHIVVIRDPAAVLQSWYEFCLERKIPFMRHNGYLYILASQLGLPEAVADWRLGTAWKSVLEFQQTSLGWRRDMSFGVSLLAYYVEFWHTRHDPNVLVLCYEDLVSDRARWIQAIARFMGVDASQDLVQRVADMTSKDSMMAHIDKFDGSGYSSLINQRGRITVKWEGSPKVRSGAHGSLPKDSLKLLQHEWAQQVAPSTGLSSYHAMRTAWRKEASALGL